MFACVAAGEGGVSTLTVRARLYSAVLVMLHLTADPCTRTNEVQRMLSVCACHYVQ